MGAQYGLRVAIEGKEVQYKEVIDKPNFYLDKEDFFNYQVYTKAKAWEHEQEVRLFIYEPSPWHMKAHSSTDGDIKKLKTFVSLSAECFEALYLGVKISTEDKEEIIQKAKTLNPNIKIYQMNIDSNTFCLIEKLI